MDQGEALSFLVLNLTIQVDPRFRSLREKKAEMKALMDRYKRGRTGRLGANHLMRKLNELAGGPLNGWGKLSENTTKSARRRKRLRRGNT